MPPDLTPETRPLAANPPRSCEDADIRSPPPSLGTADHTSNSNGGGLPLAQETPASSTSPSHSTRVGQVGSEAGAEAAAGTRVAAPAVPPVVNLYRLTPELRAAFTPIGATDSAYSFREVLLLLKTYLFSNVHLFDQNDRMYVNCESDPLGKALGVKRFHYNDVRSLISQNIIKVQPARGHITHQEPPPVPDKASSSICVGGSNDSTCRSSVPPGAVHCIPVSGTVTSQGAQQGLGSVAEPGPSRICARGQTQIATGSPPPAITCPDIPESCSDTETIYSVQDYETEFCRNTEFESSEEDDLPDLNSETYEEYELPSDDAKDDKEQFSDSDSSIDDMEIAVVAYTLVQDELEEGFWADDDSDTDEESDEDNDPECVSDRWDCLTCGLKNKPFVRYCSKCWQLRKNWLPDRPKKRKRKPRPKKRNLRKGAASDPSEDQPSSQGTSSGKNHKEEPAFESSADDSSQAGELTRTSSVSTTASRSSTQDSGFSSQDLLELQDLSEELVKEPCVNERTLAQASTSKELSQTEKQAVEDTVKPKMLSNRKRKSSSTEDVTASKRSKGMEDSVEVPFGDPEKLVRDTSNFLETSEGRAWLSSPGGVKFFRALQSSPAYQETLAKRIIEHASASTPGSASGTSTLCLICCVRPKNASIIHGRLAHQATCYQCAQRLLHDGARCPVCRRKIHMVCKQIIV